MDPLRQQQISMKTVEVFLAIEEQLLLNIAKRLKQHRTVITEDNILSWQTEQLSMLGSLTQENVKTIAKYSGLAMNEVIEALKTAGYEAVGEQETDLQEAVEQGLLIARPSFESSETLEAILTAYQAQAKSAFNFIGTTMLKHTQQAYLDVVNNVTGVVLSGAQTYEQAMKAAVRKWASHGIPALVDKSGKRWSTEAYLNMIMRSTVNNVANEMQDARMDEYGVDLVEVSSHLGARPLCAPYQGRIFSRSGTHPKYPPLSSTSYGEKAGLRGVNCRHIFHPFIEGLSKQTYKPYDERENEKEYELSQMQRSLERQIRKAKREYNMMSQIESKSGMEEARKKVLKAQENLRDFIKETGRKRNRPRERLLLNNPKINNDSSNESGKKTKNNTNIMDRFVNVGKV